MLIKICCIQSESEARVAAEAGATHVGLVGAMPSGPGLWVARTSSGSPPAPPGGIGGMPGPVEESEWDPTVPRRRPT